MSTAGKASAPRGVMVTRSALLRSIFKYFAVGMAVLLLGLAFYTTSEALSVALLSAGSAVVAFSPLLGLLTEYRKRLKHRAR